MSEEQSGAQRRSEELPLAQCATGIEGQSGAKRRPEELPLAQCATGIEGQKKAGHKGLLKVTRATSFTTLLQGVTSNTVIHK
ncbi:MAG: hypothetical protein Q8L06_12690, partial [Pseudohongiella sp.]|nr:hypothetical protein [Pseudohongiella sp.]